MTENDSVLRDESLRDQPRAGEVGVHRRPVTEPLVNPGVSRNIAPQRLPGREIATDRITGLELIIEDEQSTDGPGSARTRRGGPGRATETRGEPAASGAPGAASPETVTSGQRPTVIMRRRVRPGMVLAASAAAFLVVRRLMRGRRGRRRAAGRSASRAYTRRASGSRRRA